MLLDELQRTWQSQQDTRIRVAPMLLLRELRRNQRSFKLTIFWRDFREVFVAAALAVFFSWDNFRVDGWPWLLLAGTCVWVGGFILIDRLWRRGRAASFGDTLLGCVEASLDAVEHQIWLLKNVLWWYLLPIAIGLLVVFVERTLSVADKNWIVWSTLGGSIAFCAIVFAGVYWINQYAVRTELEPRRQELLAVRESIKGNEDQT